MELVGSLYTEFLIKISTCTEFVPSVFNDEQKEKCVDIRESVKLIGNSSYHMFNNKAINNLLKMRKYKVVTITLMLFLFSKYFSSLKVLVDI